MGIIVYFIRTASGWWWICCSACWMSIWHSPDIVWLQQARICIGWQVSLMAQGHIWFGREVVVRVAEGHLAHGGCGADGGCFGCSRMVHFRRNEPFCDLEANRLPRVRVVHSCESEPLDVAVSIFKILKFGGKPPNPQKTESRKQQTEQWRITPGRNENRHCRNGSRERCNND